MSRKMYNDCGYGCAMTFAFSVLKLFLIVSFQFTSSYRNKNVFLNNVYLKTDALFSDILWLITIFQA